MAIRLSTRRSALGGLLIPTAALVILSLAGPANASTGHAPRTTGGGQQLWLSNYAGLNGADGLAMAASPSGGTVFITGWTSGGQVSSDYATVAYNAATGGQLWESLYSGPGIGFAVADAIAVSPDGSVVFVTGSKKEASLDYVTIAYDAATGNQLWVSRYNDPPNGVDHATALALSPDGQTVFVTGSSGRGTRKDFATIAYSAATGASLWVRRYNGPANTNNLPSAMAVSPNGQMVVVTGESRGPSTRPAFATVAYNTTSGKTLWVRRYNGPARGAQQAQSVAVGPTSGSVYVTGYSGATSTALRARYVTIAYGAATGRKRWISTYAGPRNGGSIARSVAVDPSGQEVFVTGYSRGTSKADYATIAYSAATGARLWLRRYSDPANRRNHAVQVVVSPSGKRVYVTGASLGIRTSWDYATIAYGATSGSQLWVQRYNGAGSGPDVPNAMTVSSDGTVYVTGESIVDTAGDGDATTIAYRG